MVYKLLFTLVFLFVQVLSPLGTAVAKGDDSELKAAFVRDQDLWLKIGKQETMLTEGDNVRYPQWSTDGQWLAFEKVLDNQKSELWVYDLDAQVTYKIADTTFPIYRWSQHENELAYLDQSVLKVVSMDDVFEGKEGHIVLRGVGQYAWLPNGSGFLVSTEANPTDEGWGDIELLTVSKQEQEANQTTHLYTLPSQTEDYFVISTSGFKWSPDLKWIAFIGRPTASLSADGNTLFALSADGQELLKLGDMLNNENWFQWGPTKHQLAFIEGTGRMATQNKNLTLHPFSWWTNKGKDLTPAGDVDWDFDWKDERTITVSRAEESRWEEDESQRPFPVLVQVDTKRKKGQSITSPMRGFGDFYPQHIQSLDTLTWVRSDRYSAEVWRGRSDGSQARKWINDIDLGSNYYERWDWRTVLSVYQPSDTAFDKK
ncbi:TolB family protein [Caldalkalibacillus salinus]|uniref:TolB family protein n=1 Tax=Caldalkalibacillus salinus TaxID=2803787 RepID=UPI001925095E|nr:translocation protein TolB [Caldalkalibacillus salinus]